MENTKQRVAKIHKSQQRLVKMAVSLADAAEDIVEEFADYRPDFLASLRRAEEDIRLGRVREIFSLRDLM